MPRADNQTICDEFRALLTDGFHVAEGADRDATLAVTKPWRAELWRAFREIEQRLCPFPGRRPAAEGDQSEPSEKTTAD